MPELPADLAALYDAIEAALRYAEGLADADAAYDAATTVGQMGQDLTEAAALARGRALSRIRERDGLSSAQLAAQMGKSKTRVQQLMNPRRRS